MAHVIIGNTKYKRIDSVAFEHSRGVYYTTVVDNEGKERVVTKNPYGRWEFAAPLTLLGGPIAGQESSND